MLFSGGHTDEFDLHPAGAWVRWVGSIASAELYDPSTETWSLVDEMRMEKGGHLIELLEDGRVIAVGGVDPSVEVYDASSGTWTSAGEAAKSGEAYISALLGNGNVLYIGGWDGSLMDSVELYDPLTGSSSPTGSLIAPRVWANATVLADGRLLVTGGHGIDAGLWRPLALAEIYDPTSRTWSEAGEIPTRHLEHTSTVLSDGRVLVVGGAPSRTTEIFDPSTGNWVKAARTIEYHEGHTATLLPDGRVLVAGGASGTTGRVYPVTSAEVYDPATDTWTPSTEAAR